MTKQEILREIIYNLSIRISESTISYSEKKIKIELLYNNDVVSSDYIITQESD